ncbi:MAG TPA: hypothetical protein VFA75_04475 [Nevskia sp.]|jgi:hypothetical protein|nr:hypothetical protein [Nevskia sp.]
MGPRGDFLLRTAGALAAILMMLCVSHGARAAAPETTHPAAPMQGEGR